MSTLEWYLYGGYFGLLIGILIGIPIGAWMRGRPAPKPEGKE